MNASTAAPASPISAPGIFLSTFAQMTATARTPAPIAPSKPLLRARCCTTNSRRANIDPPRSGSPSSAGSCPTDDVHRDPSEEPHRDGHRQQIGDPARARYAGRNQDHSHRDREQARRRRIVGAARTDQCRERAREDRRNRRIGADRNIRIGTEDGERKRSRDERVQTRLRGKACETGRRQLLRDGDGGQHDAADHVSRQGRRVVPTQRRKRR